MISVGNSFFAGLMIIASAFSTAGSLQANDPLSSINAIIKGTQPEAPPPVSDEPAAANTSPATALEPFGGRSAESDCFAPSCGPEGVGEGQLEFAIDASEPLSALRLLTAHPVGDGTCREALFQGQPMVRDRFDVGPGTRIVLVAHDLCMIELRNDADDRTVRVRLDQRLEVMIISVAPAVFAGIDLGPNQSIALPLKSVAPLTVPLTFEAMWGGAHESPSVSSFEIVFENN